MQAPQGEESAVEQWAADTLVEVPLGTNITELPALALKLLNPKLGQLGSRLKSDRQVEAKTHAFIGLKQSPERT